MEFFVSDPEAGESRRGNIVFEFAKVAEGLYLHYFYRKEMEGERERERERDFRNCI